MASAQADLEKHAKMIFKHFNASDREEIGDLLHLLEEFEISLKGILAENEKEDSVPSNKAFNALRQQTKTILREIIQEYGICSKNKKKLKPALQQLSRTLPSLTLMKFLNA